MRLIFLTILAVLFLSHTSTALSTECSYEQNAMPVMKENRLDVFLGLNDEPISINKLESFTSVTIQAKPFRVVLFDEPDDVLTITIIESESQKAIFSEILRITDVCDGASLLTLQKLIGGIEGKINLYIDQENGAFHFWGVDRFSKSKSLTSFYETQDDIFVINRTTK